MVLPQKQYCIWFQIAEDDLEDDVVVQAINKKNKDEGWNGEDLDLGFVQVPCTNLV